MVTQLLQPGTQVRHKPRKPPKWLYPLQVQREYQKWLDQYVDRIIASVKDNLDDVLGLRFDDVRDIPPSDGWYEALRRALLEVIAGVVIWEQELEELVRGLFGQASRFSRAQFHQMLRRSYGVNIFTTEPQLSELMAIWEAENIRLIRSIPTEYVNQLQGRIVAAVQEGKSVAQLRAVIEETFDLPRNRAHLIARDQIEKLNGQLTRYRQESIGVTEYRWRGVLDQRERDEHREREGQVFEWKEPPDDGHPGHPINCRCWAEAVLPNLDDLKAIFVH